MNDALGNPIKVGKEYIYTLKNSSGHVIRTGIAKKINSKTITFEISTSVSVNDYSRSDEYKAPTKAQVKSYILIPYTLVNDDNKYGIDESNREFAKKMAITSKFTNDSCTTSEQLNEIVNVEEYYKTKGY
jgi:hypothetical protein